MILHGRKFELNGLSDALNYNNYLLLFFTCKLSSYLYSRNLARLYTKYFLIKTF